MVISSTPGPTGVLGGDTCDVLVVGGGPVGLAAAIELGTRGISVLLVERENGVVRYPTAESVDTASMELLRRWGMADRVERSGFPADATRDISFVSSMTTFELARFPRPANSDRRATTHRLSPEGGVWWPKFWFDPALRERAAAEPAVRLRYQWACHGFDDGTDGVTVRLRSSEHGRRRVRARFLVACDGAASPVRKALGIESVRESAGARARWQGAFVRLPGLRERIPHAPAVQHSSTTELIFRIPQLISYLSSLLTLESGDVILTGTPGGTGVADGRFLAAGDEVVVAIERIGALATTIAAPRSNAR